MFSWSGVCQFVSGAKTAEQLNGVETTENPGNAVLDGSPDPPTALQSEETVIFLPGIKYRNIACIRCGLCQITLATC